MKEWAKREIDLAKEREVKKAQDSAEAAYGCAWAGCQTILW